MSAEPIVLLFAYHFPPENAIGAARPYRFYKYLRRAGYRVQVYTAADPKDSALDDVTWVEDRFAHESPRGAGWHVERAFRKVFLPAALGTRWAYEVSREAEKFVAAHAGHRITLLSSYPPVGAHFAAMELKKRLGLRWIADFRDPAYYPSLVKQFNQLQRSVVMNLEREVLDTADLAITTTNRVPRVWAERYPEVTTPVHTIWNGFDPEARVTPLPLPARPYKLVSHVGHLYLGRTVVPLVEAMVRLVDAGRLPADRMRIRLVGEVVNQALADPKVLARAQAQGWLEVEAVTVPKHEALRLQRESDGLLLVQPHSSDLVPGKLYEYLQTGRPILAYVPHGSVIEDILSRSGVQYVCAYSDGSPDAFEAAVLEYFSMRFETRKPSQWFESEFDGQRQAEQLGTLIESLYQPDGEPEALTGSRASS